MNRPNLSTAGALDECERALHVILTMTTSPDKEIDKNELQTLVMRALLLADTRHRTASAPIHTESRT